jgi:hypothetical protein
MLSDLFPNASNEEDKFVQFQAEPEENLDQMPPADDLDEDMDERERMEEHDHMHAEGIEMLGKVWDMEAWLSASPMAGSFAFLLMSGLKTFAIVNNKFRFKSSDYVWLPGVAYETDAAKQKDATNYLKLADDISSYGQLVLFGAGFILQLLSTFGIAANINYLWWTMGVCLGGFALHLTSLLLLAMGVEKGYEKGKDASYKAAIRDEFASWAVAAMTMAGSYDAWMAGIWEGLSQEERDAWIEQVEADFAAKEEEMEALNADAEEKAEDDEEAADEEAAADEEEM